MGRVREYEKMVGGECRMDNRSTTELSKANESPAGMYFVKIVNENNTAV